MKKTIFLLSICCLSAIAGGDVRDKKCKHAGAAQHSTLKQKSPELPPLATGAIVCSEFEPEIIPWIEIDPSMDDIFGSIQRERQERRQEMAEEKCRLRLLKREKAKEKELKHLTHFVDPKIRSTSLPLILHHALAMPLSSRPPQSRP